MKLSFRLVGSACAVAAAAVLSGCVAVPADPYYGGSYGYNYAYPAGVVYGGPAPYYSASPYLVAPALSIGVAGTFGGHSHRHHGWRGPGWRGGPGAYGGGRGPGGGFHRGGGWGGRGGGHR